jgi:hypothetical protein
MITIYAQQEFLEQCFLPVCFDHHALSTIRNPTRQTEFRREPIDERPEANALNGASHDDSDACWCKHDEAA